MAARWRRALAVALLAILATAAAAAFPENYEAADDADDAGETALDVVTECVLRGSLSSVRPRLLAFLADAERREGRAIRITRDLAVVPNALDAADSEDDDDDEGDDAGRSGADQEGLLRRVAALERFLRGHELRVALPRELSEAVPDAVRKALPEELRLPLYPEAEAGDKSTARHRKKRGFLKQVVLPFILGLKFKATALIPLALALIALKTWKALTLGLLSVVLSAAMVIFRFTKPKVVNYDVYHYPQGHGHYDHHVDHHVDHAHHDHGHYDHYARSIDMAYRAHRR